MAKYQIKESPPIEKNLPRWRIQNAVRDKLISANRNIFQTHYLETFMSCIIYIRRAEKKMFVMCLKEFSLIPELFPVLSGQK